MIKSNVIFLNMAFFFVGGAVGSVITRKVMEKDFQDTVDELVSKEIQGTLFDRVSEPETEKKVAEVVEEPEIVETVSEPDPIHDYLGNSVYILVTEEEAMSPENFMDCETIEWFELNNVITGPDGEALESFPIEIAEIVEDHQFSEKDRYFFMKNTADGKYVEVELMWGKEFEFWEDEE